MEQESLNLLLRPDAEIRAAFERLGTPPERAGAEVDPAFGEPLLAVATGSLAAGFGNARSDVDVFAVVDAETFPIPMVSYQEGSRIDVRYFSRSKVRDWPQAFEEPWPPPGEPLTRNRWLDQRFNLEGAVRFAIGLAVAARPDWLAWRDRLRAGGLARSVVSWWQLECRRRLAAALLIPRHELHRSCHAHAEALRAALELKAAVRGEVFFGAKWLPEKLRRAYGPALAGLARHLIYWPDAADADAYREVCERTVRETLEGAPGEKWIVEIHPAPGVHFHRIGGRSLASRWEMRWVEVDGIPEEVGKGPVWSGSIDESVPPVAERLFLEDMAWLSVRPGADS